MDWEGVLDDILHDVSRVSYGGNVAAADVRQLRESFRGLVDAAKNIPHDDTYSDADNGTVHWTCCHAEVWTGLGDPRMRSPHAPDCPAMALTARLAELDAKA